MADPMTQSHQISSSQGLNDGRSKDSKFSDSFFSSSPVSLIQSPQDKRVALDSEKPSEGVPTALRFSSQPSSFSPGTYGNDNSVGIKDRSFQEKRDLFESSLGSQKQDSSPIKISPVSERIKALEALAAKQNDTDWNDTGFHFRERHALVSSHSEIHGITLRSSVKKKPTSSEQDSPESPFEILSDSRRGSDFEDTADWMRAHLPPAPNFNIAESDLDEIKEVSVMPECPSETKSKDVDVQEISSFVGVPDEFMDSNVEVSKQITDDSNQSKQDAIEDESEFDLRFLPTAYMWDKQEKSDVDAQEPTFLSENQDTDITSPAAPNDGFEPPSLEPIPSVPQADSNAKPQSATLGVGLEGAEIIEADSSGESDDTVIEDVSNGNAPECGFSTDKQIIPNEQEKWGLQVPIINVIETEDQVLSDYEVEHEEEDDDDDNDEKYQIKQEPAIKAQQPSEICDISNSEFDETAQKMDDLYSLENIVDSDVEYSPKHSVKDITNHTVDETSLSSESPTLEDTDPQSTVLQNTDETFKESSLSNVNSKEMTEIVPDLPPNYEDLSNDFESSEIDTYLDHYTSEELALKDQLNSGVLFVDNGNTNVLPKSDSPQQCQNYTVPAQQLYEETLDEFDQNVNQIKQNYDTEREPVPANVLIDLPGEPLHSQNSMTQVELDDQNIEIKDEKLITDSGTFSEEAYIIRHEAELPSFQQSTLAQFPSFHDDLSSNIIDAISDFVPSDVTELLMTNTEPDEIIQVNDSHSQISPETKSKPETIESECPIVQIDQCDTPDAQLSEQPTNIPELIETESEENKIFHCNAPDTQVSPETPSELEPTGSEASLSASTDSFVEFMRECLKSQQDESRDAIQTTKKPVSVASSSPAIIMDLEQECLTICALKEFGSSPEEKDDLSISKDIPVSAKDSNLQLSHQSKSLICSNPSPCTFPNENQTDATLTKEIEAIDIWVAEAYHLAEHVLALILTHMTVHDLVYWRDPKKSGLVFGMSLLLLLSLAAFSVISIISYLLLALLCVTISFRVYKSVIQAVQKSNEGHPFKELMQKDVSLPPETFRKHVDSCLTYINCALKQMSRLFLVEDLVDSLKLAVVMWLMTYVGAVFNGITILILIDILAFTVPPLYEKYKTQIDRYIDLARTQVNSVVAKIQEKLPKSAKRSKTE